MIIIQQLARMDKFDEIKRPFEVIWYKNTIGFTTMNLSRCLVSSRETQIILSRVSRDKKMREKWKPYFGLNRSSTTHITKSGGTIFSDLGNLWVILKVHPTLIYGQKIFDPSAPWGQIWA